MTSIDFYTHVSDRYAVAARLVAKAFAQHGNVRVLTPDAEATDALGKLLWLYDSNEVTQAARDGVLEGLGDCTDD